MGADTIVSLNFHKPESKGFFSSRLPFWNIDVVELIVPYFYNKYKTTKDLVLISSKEKSRYMNSLVNLAQTFEHYGIKSSFGILANTNK